MQSTSWKTRLAGATVLACAVWSGLVMFGPPPAVAADGEWTWPVSGRVIRPYSNDNSRPYAGGMHRGIDIAAPAGTRVIAARPGAVTFAGRLGSSGLTVAVRTADGRYVTSYLHLARIAVARGASVSSGDEIGAVGTTGLEPGGEPHLHFGVRLADSDRTYVDPLSLLPPLPGTGAGSPASPVRAPAPAALNQAPLPVPARAHAHAPRPAAHPRRVPARLPHPFERSAPVGHGAASPAAARLPQAGRRSRARGATATPARAKGREPASVPVGPGAERRPAPLRHAQPPVPSRGERGSAAHGAPAPWARWLSIAGVALLALALAARPIGALVLGGLRAVSAAIERTPSLRRSLRFLGRARGGGRSEPAVALVHGAKND